MNETKTPRTDAVARCLDDGLKFAAMQEVLKLETELEEKHDELVTAQSEIVQLCYKLAAARAEIAEYQKLFEEYDGGAAGLAMHLSANNQLRAEIAALKKDKERLDWLSSEPTDGFIMTMHNDGTIFDWGRMDSISLRQAIDKAMEAL